jgi:hypothetical protein
MVLEKLDQDFEQLPLRAAAAPFITVVGPLIRSVGDDVHHKWRLEEICVGDKWKGRIRGTENRISLRGRVRGKTKAGLRRSGIDVGDNRKKRLSGVEGSSARGNDQLADEALVKHGVMRLALPLHDALVNRPTKRALVCGH